MVTQRQWWSLEKAADYLQSTPAALHKAVQRGQLKAYLFGRRLKFRQADLDAAVRRRVRTTHSR